MLFLNPNARVGLLPYLGLNVLMALVAFMIVGLSFFLSFFVLHAFQSINQTWQYVNCLIHVNKFKSNSSIEHLVHLKQTPGKLSFSILHIHKWIH